MNISFFDIEPSEKAAIEQSLKGNNLTIHEGEFSTESPNLDQCEVLSFFVSAHIGSEELDALPKLKCIATRSTGFDHIDVAECKKRGIVVMNVPAYGAETVAEYAFALMLALTRKVHQAAHWVETQKAKYDMYALRGTDLNEKTLGVIGTGRIGKEVIRIAQGFNMNVVAYDIYEDKEYAEKMGYTYTTLEELLEQADIITLHCPCTPETQHTINKENISEIKKGAFLINTARGELVETDAVIEALENGTLQGAALDVLEEEKGATFEKGRSRKEEINTIVKSKKLQEMPNVILTPHNAFNSKEAVARILETTLKNIEGFIDGTPQNVVE